MQERRWIGERSLGWIGRNRRLAGDCEHSASTALALIFLANACVLLERLTPEL